MRDGSAVRSHEIIVPRTARYAVLGADASRAEEIWLVCHGYGQLASRFIRRFDVIDNGKRLIVAPEALSRFYLSGGTGPHSAEEKVGASWMTREARDAEIDDQVGYLDTVLERVLEGSSRQNVRIVGFGFSQARRRYAGGRPRYRRGRAALVRERRRVGATVTFQVQQRPRLARFPGAWSG